MCVLLENKNPEKIVEGQKHDKNAVVKLVARC
jgi:hypothetical protein